MGTPPLSPELAREAYEARERHGGEGVLGSLKAAAAELGLDVSTLKHRINKHNAYSNQDPAIASAMAAVNTGMTPSLAWVKTKDELGNGVSVLLKPSVATEDALEKIRAAFEGMKAAKPITPPENTLDDYCTVYPLMDAHFGMHAWGRETGSEDYDIKYADIDMHHAFSSLSVLTPKSQKAILIIGGDFFHADDHNSETPKSKHKLDVDGRHWKVLDEGVKLLASIIEGLAGRHSAVLVRVLRGNHDEHAHLVLTFALAERYREDERIDIEKDPRDIFMSQWGTSLIAAHHGDKAKPERLTLYLSDICPFWSETRHRHLFVGHVHHDNAKDIGPMRWESLRAFCPPDSYAASMGYGARRAMQSITFHKRHGIVLRALDPIERQ